MIQLKSELFTRLHAGGKPRVLEALQSAVELEHATIPLYLYSLYSLDEKSNRAIAGIIQSVVIEEMLHMTLACNILNALGGSPVVDSPTFIPAYPGPLPGGVEDQLVVQLAPFSYDQLETFITVEEPEDPLEFPLVAAAAAPAKPLTIGQFYQEIARQITALGDSAFVPGPRNQIGPDQMDDAVIVTNTTTALKAINIIIDQGEGTSNSPLEHVGSDYAHYYRYMEIKMGRRLVPTPGTQPPVYSYSGARLELDPNGVYPVPTNPKASNYPAGSAARQACDRFNYTYTSLLKGLHATFNGDSSQLNTAIGLMMSLKAQAKAMMSGIPNPGQYMGPSFEYQPVNQ